MTKEELATIKLTPLMDTLRLEDISDEVLSNIHELSNEKGKAYTLRKES